MALLMIPSSKSLSKLIESKISCDCVVLDILGSRAETNICLYFVKIFAKLAVDVRMVDEFAFTIDPKAK